MKDIDKQSVIQQLEAYQKDFADLLTLLEKLPLKGSKKEEAQQRMKALKSKLKAAVKAGGTVRGQNAMNKYEKAFLYPAIQEASANIQVSWNSVPSQKWFSELYSGRGDMSHMLGELKRSKK